MPESRADYWFDAAEEILDRAEETRHNDPELSEVLFLVAQSAARLGQAYLKEVEA